MVAEGATILDAVRQLGDSLPSICHDPRTRPAGNCRLCLVEIQGEPRPVPSCVVKAQDDMIVTARSGALERFRRRQVEWYAARISPESAARYPDKELHRLMRDYGVAPAGIPCEPINCDNSVPTIRVDMSQCIQCLRCVRICEELQGQFVWHAIGRGSDISIVPSEGSLMLEGGCVSCGACSDSCPTGALADSHTGRPETWTRTVCPYCGVGCELEVGTTGGRLVAARPVLDAPVSKGHLCTKGRYGFDFVHAPDRLVQPQIRRNGRWSPSSWETVIDHCAARLQHILREFGPQAVGVLGSSRATNEENYLAQKFARVVLGTNNVDCCARVCHTPSAKALKSMLGTGAATNCFDDIEKSRAIMVVGANPLECHPIVGARIRQQVLRGKAELIVIDPRRTELSLIARVHLQVKPGTDIPLINALAHVIVTEALVDRDFIQTRVDGLDAFSTFIQPWTPERAARICEVAAEDIRAAARLYATARPAFCAHGLGLTEHVQGTETVMALVNLALLTGNLGKEGSGINPLRGQNNVQGAAHMGCDPTILTGAVAIPERRKPFEKKWHTRIPRTRGLNLMEMMDAAAAGRLKALWVMGYDILPTLAHEATVAEALYHLDLVIIQDLFMTETANAAGHVILPAASSFEKDGTFMNAERRIQRIRRAVPPPGACLPDWEIICALAARMGFTSQFNYGSPEDIWEEIRQLWPEGAGISYSRLEAGGLQWPCRDEQDGGTSLLHKYGFASGPKAALRPIEYQPTRETVSDEFPFLLTTGRRIYQFNVGNMTRRTSNVQLRSTDTLDIAPIDGQRLGLAEGQMVNILSRYGEASLPVHLDTAMIEGQAFATFHDPRVHLNRVTGPYRDAMVGAPEYKVTAVNISAVTQAPCKHENSASSGSPTSPRQGRGHP